MASHDALVSFGSTEAWRRATLLVAGALRRRWLSIAALVVLFGAVGVTAAVLLPRSYSAESRLLVQKNYVMPALAHPRRAVPIGGDSPTQSAAIHVRNRQALLGMIERLHLLERWDRERPALLRAKDRLVEALKGPIAPEDKADALVEVLEKRLRVNVQEEILEVTATWSDPRTVVDIVNDAVGVFLEARRKIDVQTVADTSKILSTFAEREHARVVEQVDALASARQFAPAPTGGAPAGERPRPADGAPPTEARGGLRDRLFEARNVRAELERQHAEQVAALEAKIAERRAIQTERHPEMQALRRALERLAAEPASLADARRAESQLMAEFVRQGGTEQELAAPEPASTSPVVARATAPGATEAESAARTLANARNEKAIDEAADYQMSLLKNAIAAYEDLRGRLADVQIELETAQAAFAYKYSVIAPARPPKKADSPNVPLIVIAAVFSGAFAGVVRAIFAELRSRALLSPSALGQHLGLAGAALQS